MFKLFRTATLASAISAALVLSGLVPAGAAVPLSGVVSATPVSWTPNVFAGTTSSTTCQQFFGGPCSAATVHSTAIVNGEVVVAGAFTQACQPGPASSGHCQSGTQVTRDDIFAYQLGTGVIDPNFAPTIDAGPVFSVVAGPNNTVYIGGSFSTVNGDTHAGGIAQLNVTPGNTSTDGQLVTGFTGHLDNTVRHIALNGNALYLGGDFKSADSTPVTDLVRMNATTGTLDSTFSMTLSNPVQGKTGPLPLKVESMALTPDGSTLAIGGTFQDVNGQSRPRVALISTGGGLGSTATLDAWTAPIFANNCSAQHDYVRGIDFSPDGSFFVVADTGFKSGKTGAASVCDATARFETNITNTNAQPTWTNYAGGDSQYTVAVTGSTVYVGGHNRWVNNECGDNTPCEADLVLVMGLTAIDANTGLGIPWWHPLTLRGQGLTDVESFPAGLFSGSNGGLLVSDNTNLNGAGAFHSFNALFPLTSTTATPTFGSIPSGIFLDGRLGGFDESTSGIAAMCVDDPGNSTTAGTKVDFATCTNGAGQNWTAQNGNIQINGLCLDTVGGGTASGTQVDLNTCSSSTSQVWTQGAGNTLVSKASNLCLTDPGSSTTNGTVLDITSCTTPAPANQVWPLPAAPVPSSLIPTGPVSSSALQSDTQPACLTDSGNSMTSGAAVVMSTCFGNQPQNASIQTNGNIQINGLCLDTKGGATANGTPVVLNTCNASATTQVWTQQGSGHTVVNKAAPTECLNAASSANGSALTIATCSSTSSLQKWWLPAV